jgi:hypothetical protein
MINGAGGVSIQALRAWHGGVCTAGRAGYGAVMGQGVGEKVG